MSEPLRVAPVIQFVRSLDGEYYTLQEAADIIGINSRVLRNLNSDPATFKTLGPSYITNFGKVQVYLYTKADIASIKQWRKDRLRVVPATAKIITNAGRPTIWTAEERKYRHKLYSRANYYRSQLKAVEASRPPGVTKKIKEYKALIKSTMKELKDHEHSVRG